MGASVAQTFGAFPAFNAALINTEVRDGTQFCFHDHDRDLYRAKTGKEFPDAAVRKNGVSFLRIEGSPIARTPDDDDLLQFFRGSGAGRLERISFTINNGPNHRTLRLWTFFDPAVRVPALWNARRQRRFSRTGPTATPTPSASA